MVFIAHHFVTPNVMTHHTGSDSNPTTHHTGGDSNSITHHHDHTLSGDNGTETGTGAGTFPHPVHIPHTGNLVNVGVQHIVPHQNHQTDEWSQNYVNAHHLSPQDLRTIAQVQEWDGHGTFIHHVGHDMTNPFATRQAYDQLVAQHNLTPDQLQHLAQYYHNYDPNVQHVTQDCYRVMHPTHVTVTGDHGAHDNMMSHTTEGRTTWNDFRPWWHHQPHAPSMVT